MLPLQVQEVNRITSSIVIDMAPVLNATQTQADVWLHQMIEDFLRKTPLLSCEPHIICGIILNTTLYELFATSCQVF